MRRSRLLDRLAEEKRPHTRAPASSPAPPFGSPQYSILDEPGRRATRSSFHRDFCCPKNSPSLWPWMPSSNFLLRAWRPLRSLRELFFGISAPSTANYMKPSLPPHSLPPYPISFYLF